MLNIKVDIKKCTTEHEINSKGHIEGKLLVKKIQNRIREINQVTTKPTQFLDWDRK